MGGEMERDLHKSLVKLLREKQSHDEFLFFHIKNDVGSSRNTRFYDPRPLGVVAGVADFCILRNGKTYFLEIKSNKGRLSKEQRKFLVEVNRLGHVGIVGFGWNDIMDKLDGIFNDKQRSVKASQRDGEAGTVVWVDNRARFLKRRPKQGFSLFLY